MACAEICRVYRRVEPGFYRLSEGLIFACPGFFSVQGLVLASVEGYSVEVQGLIYVYVYIYIYIYIFLPSASLESGGRAPST